MRERERKKLEDIKVKREQKDFILLVVLVVVGFSH